MTTQQTGFQGAQAASVPNPLGGQPTAPPNPTGGTSSGAGVQDFEAQFLGSVFKTVFKTLAPIGLDLLRSHISSTPASVQQDSAAVAQEAQQFETQFLPFLGAILPGLVSAIPEVIRAFQGQAAGADAGASGAGAVPAQAR